MAKPKTVRRREKKNISSGIAHVNASFNNTMITITDVEVSGDLQHCKIFVSIFGDSNHKNAVFSELEASQAFLKGELGRRLKMRRAPEVLFKLDRGMEKGTPVLDLLGQLENERKAKNSDLTVNQD